MEGQIKNERREMIFNLSCPANALSIFLLTHFFHVSSLEGSEVKTGIKTRWLRHLFPSQI